MADSPAPSTPAELTAYKRFLMSQIVVKIGTRGTRKYTPHPGQLAMHFPTTPWTYFVAPWGARAGKTIATALEVIFMASQRNTRTWIVAPIYTLTDKCFAYVYDWIVVQQIFGPGSVKKASWAKDTRYIQMAWGAIIEGKTAEKPDSLVGEQVDLIAFDECARCSERIWLGYLEGRTLDRKGKVIFISTPRGFNWYKKYFDRTQNPETKIKGWQGLHFATWENPFIDKEFLDAKKAETPEDVWKQEYGGEFTSFAGLIYPGFTREMYPKGHIYDPKEFPFEESSLSIRAIDIGARHPTAALWGELTVDNDIKVYQEYQERNPLHDVHAERIAALSVRPTFITWISPDAARKSGLRTGGTREENLCANDSYMKAGVYAIPASNEVKAGTGIVNRYLTAALEKNSAHPQVIISKDCPRLIEAFGSYIWAEQHEHKDLDAQEKPRKFDDHLMDAFRYLLASTPQHTPLWMEDMDHTLGERQDVIGMRGARIMS